MKLLVLRPEPGASATRARAEAAGWEVVSAPLFEVRALDWMPPAGPFDAIMATSANALRHGGAALAYYTALPLYAVGAATAEAARAAGFARIVSGDDDAAALLAKAAADGVGHLLHLAGREHRIADAEGVTITRMPVYASDPVDSLPLAAKRAIRDGAIALLHSPRAAALLARLVPDPDTLAFAAISTRAAAAAGPGWYAVAVAARPTDTALLAAAAGLCERSDGRPT